MNSRTTALRRYWKNRDSLNCRSYGVCAHCNTVFVSSVQVTENYQDNSTGEYLYSIDYITLNDIRNHDAHCPYCA